MDLFAVGYVSIPTSPLSSEGVQRLLQEAQARNEADGITGQLILVESDPSGRAGPPGRIIRYVQWIEGPPAAVQRCAVRISQDTRHTAFRLAYLGPVAERRYADWSMSIERVPTEVLAASVARVTPPGPRRTPYASFSIES